MPVPYPIERARSIDMEAVIKSLEKMDHQGLFSRVVFDKKHDMMWGPDYYQDRFSQWVDGKLVPIFIPDWRRLRGP